MIIRMTNKNKSFDQAAEPRKISFEIKEFNDDDRHTKFRITMWKIKGDNNSSSINDLDFTM